MIGTRMLAASIVPFNNSEIASITRAIISSIAAAAMMSCPTGEFSTPPLFKTFRAYVGETSTK